MDKIDESEYDLVSIKKSDFESGKAFDTPTGAVAVVKLDDTYVVVHVKRASGWKCMRCWKYTHDDNPVEMFDPDPNLCNPSGRLCNRCLKVVAEMLINFPYGKGNNFDTSPSTSNNEINKYSGHFIVTIKDQRLDEVTFYDVDAWSCWSFQSVIDTFSKNWYSVRFSTLIVDQQKNKPSKNTTNTKSKRQRSNKEKNNII